MQEGDTDKRAYVRELAPPRYVWSDQPAHDMKYEDTILEAAGQLWCIARQSSVVALRVYCSCCARQRPGVAS